MNTPGQSSNVFRIINGGGAATPSWAQLPSTVIGRSPFDKAEPIAFRLAKNDVIRQLEAGRRQPLYEAWGSIIGRPPPVPNVSRLSEKLARMPLLSLAGAHACFRGLKRPIGNDPRGFDHFAYILKPTSMVVYRPDMVCLAHIAEVPPDLVFAIYCRMDYPLGITNQRVHGTRPTRGVITHWGFVEADASDPLLPVGYTGRYRLRMW